MYVILKNNSKEHYLTHRNTKNKKWPSNKTHRKFEKIKDASSIQIITIDNVLPGNYIVAIYRVIILYRVSTL